MKRPRGAVLALSALLLGACVGDTRSRLTPEEQVFHLQDLLVRGTAHAEIDEWPQAIELFNQATELADGDPVVAFDLAVAHFRNGDRDSAKEWLGRVDAGAPDALLARAEYLRGKLALEEGDAQGEADAYRRASALDPSEAAFPYSLSQVVPRLGGDDVDTEVGALLARCAELWPDNGRIAAELAQWALGQTDAKTRSRGVDLVIDLAAGQPDVEALVTRGLDEIATDRPPVSLRRALNLLRPGKRFQTDSAALEARLAVLPLAEPVNESLRSRGAPHPAEMSLASAALLPQMPFAQDEQVLQIWASNDAVAEPGTGTREADLSILTDEGLWALGRGDAAYTRIATWRNAPRELLVGELDGDGWMEILVLGEKEVSLWGRSQTGRWSSRRLEPSLAAAGGLRNAILLDFEHDGDLDLLATDTAGQLVLVTHRGEAGLGEPEPAPLPDIGRVALVRTFDVDGDIDQDLLIAGGTTVRVLTNLRQGEFRPGQELAGAEGAGEFEDLLSVDYDSDGRFDVVGVIGGTLTFLANKGPAGLVLDEGAGERVKELLEGERVDAINAADMDLDGDLDLLVAHSNEGGSGTLTFLREGGGPGVGGRIALPSGAPLGVTAIDLDGDRDPDPIIWGKAGAATVKSTGAESQGWLGVSLRGLLGKVPLDGRGARVDLSFGLDSRSFELERPEIVLGLGGRKPSLVKVTWPNGISEFLFDPQPNTTHVIEQELRIEGSCPFLYASDGREMRFVTDILGLAPLGMLAGPGRYVPADPEEYLRLPGWVASDRTVELRITEELREVAYLDQTELVVVDVPPGVEVYNGERWIEGTIDGLDLRLLGALETPTAVTGNDGSDALGVVAELDDRYLTNHSGTRLYQGAVQPHRLEIEIPSRIAETGRAALVLTGWLHWGNTSMNLARAQDPDGAPIFPYLEVPATGGGWRRVDLDVGLPAGKTKPVVVDLAGVVDAADPRVRITTDFEVYWDRIAVAEALPVPATEHRIHRLAPASAELYYGGFSRWYRPAENGPYLFDYSERRPYPWRENDSGARAIAWQEHEGFYTRYGSVRDLVAEIDDQLAVFGAGEELALSFDVATVPPLPLGWKRTLFLHSEGWEKDGDPNVACGQTVGPLPFRGMGEYPCSRSADVQPGAFEPGMRADRWVDRSRLARRVAAWSEVR